METLSLQILKTMGRWAVVLFLFSGQAAQAQESFSSLGSSSIWHNALFIFSICFFVAGFIFLFMLKAREEQKNKVRGRYLRQRHHYKH